MKKIVAHCRGLASNTMLLHNLSKFLIQAPYAALCLYLTQTMQRKHKGIYRKCQMNWWMWKFVCSLAKDKGRLKSYNSPYLRHSHKFQLSNLHQLGAGSFQVGVAHTRCICEQSTVQWQTWSAMHRKNPKQWAFQRSKEIMIVDLRLKMWKHHYHLLRKHGLDSHCTSFQSYSKNKVIFHF